MLETVGAAESDCIRGGGERGLGMPRGGEMVSSGEVGGEGESRGDCCSSGDAMVCVLVVRGRAA